MRAPVQHILIVEDSHELRVVLRDFFELQDYQVTVALNGALALEMVRHLPAFDLVLLDLSLPDVDGFEVLRAIRAAGPTPPVVIFTGHGNHEAVVRGFELGADDYVTKPVHAEELLARVEAILARTKPPHQAPMKVHRVGKVEINFSTHEAFRGRQRLVLTPEDFDILRYLVANKGRTVPHEELLENVRGLDDVDGLARLDEHVRSLRELIDPEEDEPAHLEAVDGIGYRLEP